MKSTRRTLSFCALTLIILCFLTSCAALSAGSFTLDLGGNYAFISDGRDKLIVLQDTDTTPGSIVGTGVIDTYVDQLAFDLHYICARQRTLKENGEVDRQTAPLYFVIATVSGEIFGPMTESEFSDRYAALGREEPPKWISTKDQPALIDRWEELNPGHRYE